MRWTRYGDLPYRRLHAKSFFVQEMETLYFFCTKFVRNMGDKVQNGPAEVQKMLYEGMTRKQILQVFQEKFKISDRSIDKWIAKARPIVDKMLQEDAAIYRQESERLTRERVTALNITKDKVVERLVMMGFGDIRKLYGEDNQLLNVKDLEEADAAMIDGIEVMEETDRKGNVIGYTRKVKRQSQIAALQELNRMLGYNAPTKTSLTDADGNPIPTRISLNLG